MKQLVFILLIFYICIAFNFLLKIVYNVNFNKSFLFKLKQKHNYFYDNEFHLNKKEKTKHSHTIISFDFYSIHYFTYHDRFVRS